MPTSPKKSVVITGANKGIGFEVARGLARAGLTVYLAARDAERGRAAAESLRGEGLDVRDLVLDVTDQVSVDRAVATFRESASSLDVLINNAGIVDHSDGPPTCCNPAAMERTYVTNVVGPVRVTQAFLPLLRQSPAASILNISSDLGSLTRAADPSSPYYPHRFCGYAGTKAALNMFTVHLAGELKDTSIRVNSVNPGFTATDFNGNRGPQTVEEGAREVLRVALLEQDVPSGVFVESAGVIPW